MIIVIPLAKTRDHKNLNDYRPVSLLSVQYKLLKRHVHKHLVNYLETRDFSIHFSKASAVSTLAIPHLHG